MIRVNLSIGGKQAPLLSSGSYGIGFGDIGFSPVNPVAPF